MNKQEFIVYGTNAIMLLAVVALIMHIAGNQAWAVGFTIGFFMLAILNGVLCISLQKFAQNRKKNGNKNAYIAGIHKSLLFGLVQLVVGSSVCGGAISGVVAAVKYYFFG